MTLGDRPITVARPRAGNLEAGEASLAIYAWARNRDPLDAGTLASIAAGVSRRHSTRVS
jgi:hypothetical protein